MNPPPWKYIIVGVTKRAIKGNLLRIVGEHSIET
jgi:hypothetical protein